MCKTILVLRVPRFYKCIRHTIDIDITMTLMIFYIVVSCMFKSIVPRT